jgi:acetylornithine deacetylase/succinyl-diaminopimelate desuccinylase-like protein
MPSVLTTTSALRHARSPTSRRRWLHELSGLLAFPTVSARPDCRPALEACARWLALHLRTLGLRDAQVLDGAGGPPSVYASWRGAPSQPTLLLYGHYDVQPAEPLAAWRTPPFRATRAGQHLYARGASDDKGQLFIHLKAIECYLATSGRLPLNILVWLEGEEELGSPHLAAVLERHAERLRADAALVSDTEMFGPGRPAIIYGLRGSLACEIEVTTRAGELHAGRYGGAAPNAAQALAAILAALHDPRGRIAIPDFYRRVSEVSPDERRDLRAGGLADRRVLLQVGGAQWGEAGYTPFERTSIRPALNITGLAGGYTGPGGKGSIPTRAIARLNIRLVPDQVPGEVVQQLRSYVATLTPPGLRTQVHGGTGASAVLLPRQHASIAAAARAVEQVWEVPPVFTRSGGAIGPVEQLYRQLGMPVVLLGFGQPDDNIHGPNERMSLPTLFRGVETIIRVLAEYGQ